VLKKEGEAHLKKRPPLTFKNVMRTLYWWITRKLLK
jgi:hypothetical protein